MKIVKKLFYFNLIVLFSCSGGNKSHNTSAYNFIDFNNSITIKKINGFMDRSEIMMIFRQTRFQTKPIRLHQQNILNQCALLYDEITKEIKHILDESGCKNEYEQKPFGFDELFIVPSNYQDSENYNFAEGKSLLEKFEKLANFIGKEIYLDENTMQEKYSSPFTRPTRIDNLKKYNFENSPPLAQKTLEQIMYTLLFPIEINGKAAHDEIFNDQCITSTIEQLNLMRQRILLACEISLEHLDDIYIARNRIKINKVEPMAFKIDGLRNDSILIMVVNSVYDTTSASTVHYSVDNGKEYTITGGRVLVPKNAREVSGNISISQNGDRVWKPWSIKLK